MAEIPQKIKAVKNKAVEEVYSKEIAQMDENSRALLYKVLDYMEKKYISIPISVAKDALEQQCS
ncbi:MAG: hypothetical protein IPL35_08225 [Sphingobacteriales bacterium]|nr:hypothetical protein [Sphingobacteriales bacterium]